MCGPYFDKGFLTREWQDVAQKISEYHVHIYYTNAEQQMKAHNLGRKLEQLFGDEVTDIAHVGLVGPHTKPNYEVSIKDKENFGKIMQWLQMNSDGLSVLIHPRTGDELRDHEATIWLGTPVAFNDTFLDHFREPATKVSKRKIG